MAKWEYKIIVCTNDYSDNTSILNREGENGWELVSAVNRPSTNTYASNSSLLNRTEYIFKRLKEN